MVQSNELQPSDVIQTPQKISRTCTNCRERHIKCDGLPICSRCQTDGKFCTYVISQRGRGPKPRRHHRRLAGNSAKTPSSLMVQQKSYTTNTSRFRNAFDIFNLNEHIHLPPQQTWIPPASHHTDHLFHMFYTYFWPAHPFVLPRDMLYRNLSINQFQPLQAAIEFLGSCYDPSMRQEYFRDIAESLLLQQAELSVLARNIFTVQALLLFCVGLYFCGEIEKAMSTLRLAERFALKFQLNKESSIIELSNGNEVIAECFRRTWWELYLFSGHLTAPNLHLDFRLYTVDCDTCLPCEDDSYFSGNIPPPISLTEYENRAKPNGSETKTFSSYTYRIDAMRLLSRVIAANRHRETSSSSHHHNTLDNELIDWLLNLPPSKKKLTRQDGTLDEVMLLAHLNIYGALISFHRPLSSLSYIGYPILQIKDSDSDSSRPEKPSTATLDHHAWQALYAAGMIRTLITALLPSMAKSPLITCSLSLSALIHLAALPLVSTAASDNTYSYSCSCSSGCGVDVIHQTVSPPQHPCPHPYPQWHNAPSAYEMEDDSTTRTQERRQELEDQILFELRTLREAAKLWGIVKVTLQNMEYVGKVVEYSSAF